MNKKILIGIVGIVLIAAVAFFVFQGGEVGDSYIKEELVPEITDRKGGPPRIDQTAAKRQADTRYLA